MDPRTPVLVGGGQITWREDTPEPIDMLVAAVRAAADDAGASALAEAVESVRIPRMLSWKYRDPGALVGERLGAAIRHSVYTGDGGSHSQALVNDAAEDIAAGRVDVVVVGGAEAWRTRMALKKTGERPDWTVQDDDVAKPETRPGVPMWDDSEMRAGIDRPAYVYPLFEQALRISAGRSVAEHRAAVSQLWARFSAVAATNPHAWSRTAMTADEIATPSPTNRMVSAPYPKLMNSNNFVDQAAAVIVCSVEAARRHGVPEDRWVFLRGGSEASDTARIGERRALDASPAIRYAGAAALAAAGVTLDEIGAIDLYSCFPSAVQVAAAELGLALDDPRGLTVTGGLTFAGGPWNNYSTHAIAAILAKVRANGEPALVTANSGYLTKHSIGVYAATPGEGFRRTAVQPQVDAQPTTPLSVEVTGDGELEAWTVVHDRDGNPEQALAAIRLPDGSRTLARSTDGDLAAHLTVSEAERSKVSVAPDASFTLVG